MTWTFFARPASSFETYNCRLPGIRWPTNKEKIKWVGSVDPFDSVTIASVCMNVYRTKFLEEEWRVKLLGDSDWTRAKYSDGHLYLSMGGQWVPKDQLSIAEKEFVSSPIAKIPPGGYKIDQYSKSSIQWLEWMSHNGRVRIQHALNGGERSLLGTRYKLDGFCHGVRVPRVRVSRMSPMFPWRQRRDKTTAHTTVDERTLRPDTEKESLRRMSGYEIRLCMGTRVSWGVSRKLRTSTFYPELRRHERARSTRQLFRRPDQC